MLQQFNAHISRHANIVQLIILLLSVATITQKFLVLLCFCLSVMAAIFSRALPVPLSIAAFKTSSQIGRYNIAKNEHSCPFLTFILCHPFQQYNYPQHFPLLVCSPVLCKCFILPIPCTSHTLSPLLSITVKRSPPLPSFHMPPHSSSSMRVPLSPPFPC